MVETCTDILEKKRKDVNIPNGSLKSDDHRTEILEFIHRDSPLTVLIKGSLHIRVIYHIFVTILLILLCETIIYDFIEHGNINIGVTSVVDGFGDIRRGVKIWLLEFTIAIAFYPGLRVYAVTKKILNHLPVVSRIWSIAGVLGVIAMNALIILIPTWNLAMDHLAIFSAAIVLGDMFRLAMKIISVAVACGPRCGDGGKNLPSFKHYFYFLFAPTLLYRDEYPRTKNIRWTVVLYHFLEAAAIVLCYGLLWERFILTYWSGYGKELKVDAGIVVRGIFAGVFPGLVVFFGSFYCVLHAAQNAFAEMLTFGDRLFYEEWWTTSEFSEYYRTWNRLVYSWLRAHIYLPLEPWVGRSVSIVTVFMISAVAHEVLLSLAFGFFYPVLFVEFAFFGLLLIPLTATSGRCFPNVLNLLMWLAFFMGNGLLFSLYSMEYYARKNCPPSENDSFFIPKSWSCPKIVFKPNRSY